MLASLAILAIATAAVPAAAGDTPAVAATDRFADREQARIPFESEIDGWRFEREGNDDILYVEGTRNRWYRAELSCFGVSTDPESALGMIPITSGGGFDRFSRVRFVDGFGGRHSRHDSTECQLKTLVELTEEEAFEFNLRRRPRGAPAVAPQS
jgi:hypothetical protein